MESAVCEEVLGFVISRAATSKTLVLMKSSDCFSKSSIFSTSRRRSLSLPHASSRNAARRPGSWSSAASKSSSTFRQRSGFILGSFGDHSIEPCFRALPLASNCSRRDVEYFGCFLDAQTAEVTQFDDLALLRIKSLKLAKCFLESEEVRRLLFRDHGNVIQ